MDNLEAWNEFRRNETEKACKLICCECGGPAEGNVSCDDGEICDDCNKDIEVFVSDREDFCRGT